MVRPHPKGKMEEFKKKGESLRDTFSSLKKESLKMEEFKKEINKNKKIKNK